MKTDLKIIKQCPHWIDKDGLHECNIAKGGLFIPLPQHIESFCLSELYDKCSQYIRAYELLREPGLIETAVAGDRRKNRRIGCDYSLYFSPLDEMGLRKEKEQKEAKSIDISLGGMRINSFAEIPHQQMMFFVFGTDQGEAGSIAVIGQVQWYNETQDQGYLAGVSFVFLHEAMKEKLRNRICSKLM
jgi:hypothetical protein